MTFKNRLTDLRNKFTDRLMLIFQQRWLNIGLRAKMGFIVIIGLIGLLSIYSLMSINTATQVTQQVLNERVMLARMSAMALDSKLRLLDSVLRMAAQNQVTLDPNVLPEGLRYQLLQMPEIESGILLVDASDNVVFSADIPDHINFKELASLARELSQSQQNLAVIPGNHPLAMISVPIMEIEGSNGGAIAAILDLTRPEVLPFTGSFDLGESGVLEVVESNGRVLFSTNPGNYLNQKEREAVVSRLFMEGKLGVETCLGCSDARMPETLSEVIAFAPLYQAPWGVVIRQTSDGIFAPVRRLSFQTFILGLVTVAGALGLVWLTTKSVIDPVQALTIAAERFAQGDLGVPVGQDHKPLRGDEIGILADSFDAMRIHLKTSIEEFQTLNKELDVRIRDRTLAATTAQLEAQNARDDLRATIDAISDKLVVIGIEDRRVQLVNTAAQEDRDLRGSLCEVVFHKDHHCDLPQCECPLPKVLKTGKPVRVTHVHRDSRNGSQQYVEIVASPMCDSNGKITRVIELIRDVTEEKEIKESLLRRNQQLSIINSIMGTISHTLDLEGIITNALDEVLRLTSIDVGAVFLLEENQPGLRLMASRGLSDDAAKLASEMGMLDSSCGGVLDRRQVIVVPNLDRKRGRRVRSLQRENVKTLVHIPLISKGNPLGSMCVGLCTPMEFKDEDKDLLTAIGSQIAVAIENARLYAEIQQKEHISRELFKKSITAQEEERKRIARELHDDTSQALTTLLFAAEEGLEIHDRNQLRERLTRMRDLAQSTINSVHKIIFDLRPSMLDHLGLMPALRWFANARLEEKGIRVTFKEVNEPRRLPPELETALFRVFQEAITNIARHAGARNVNILFEYRDDLTMVSIEDDGIGFDLYDLTLDPDSLRGLGLIGMQERLELLGGDLEIKAVPGQGTRIILQVPILNRSRVDE